MKKFLSILLAIVMLLQTAAFAAPMAVTTSDSAVEMPMFVEENEEIALSAESYPTDLASMRKRAEAIVNYKWTPSTDIATWNGNPTTDGKTVFEKGVPVVGMPYTLFTWEFGSDSLLSLAQYKTKAESNYTGSKYCNAVGEQRVGPVYGSCCATFVSEVFGGSFMNGDSPRYDGCMNIMDSAYSETITNATISQIREGDALVKDDYWHIIWVSEITDTKMVIYEQTYPVARKVTINKPSGNATLVYNGYSYPYIVRSKELETMSLSSGGLTLSDLKAKFQENSYWNGGNADLCTSFPCKCKHNSSHTAGSSSVSCTCNSFWGSIQCAGFALKIIYDVYKQDCTVDWVKKTSSSYIDQVKPGDYIRYGGHSVVVVAVDGDYITVGECNWGSPCRINWTRTESKSHFKSGFSHVYVAPYALPGSDASDSDSNPDSVDHECSSCVTVTNTGGYVSGVDSVLRVRTGPGTNYSVAFTMNPDTAVVIKTMCNGWYFVVDVGGNSGWVSGQYITITNGGYDIDTRYPTPFNCRKPFGDTSEIYSSINGTKTGGYISYNDDCTINQIYTNGWINVTYPAGNTKKTVYCLASEFFYGNYTNVHNETAVSNTTAYYLNTLDTSPGDVWSGDSCTVVGELNNFYQIICPWGDSSEADTGRLLVWVSKDAFKHTCVFVDEGSFEYDHPHRRYKICSCGKTQLIDGLIAFTELHTEGYDSAHPHKKYWHCTYEYCGINDYSYCNGETRYDASCAECTVPDKPVISVSKTTWSENDTIYFSWQACNNADYYYPMVYDSNGTRVAVVWGQSERSYTVRLSPGTYYLQVASVNANTGKTVYSESTAINVISLPTNESITASSDYILEGDTVTFTMYASNAVKYYYGIDSEHAILVFLEEAQGNTFSYTFDEPGEYYLWFEAVNSAGGSSLSSSFTFVVNPLVYDIKFNTNGGYWANGNIQKKYDVDIKIPDDWPTRTGYKFLGWSTTAGGNVQYLPGDTYVLNKNLALYAVWRANTYTVKYNANGGSGTMSDSAHTYDVAKALNTNTFTRTGYTFLGWSTSASATTATYTDKQSVKNLTSTNGATVTLYAVWKANTYTVKYNANGGSGSMPNSTHTYDTAKALTANAFTRSGYTFLGWSTSSSATTATYTDKQSVKNLTSTNGEVVNLYAVWAEKGKYIISFDTNGAGTTIGAQTKYHDEDLKLLSYIPPRTGYTFKEWLATNGVAYAPGSIYTANSTTTLVAQWRPNTYTVKYNANGGSGTMLDSTHTYDVAKTLNANTFARTGHTFLGWSTSASATTATYTDKQSVKNLTSTNGATVNLYAIWSKISTYTVSYDANGGTGAPASQTKIHGTNLSLSSAIPLKTGYKFVNWKASDNALYNPGDTYDKNSQTTMVAQWKAITYKVKFDANGGEGTMGHNLCVYDFENSLDPNRFEREGYEFVGWSTNKSATKAEFTDKEKVLNLTTVDGDVVLLYAVWRKVETFEIEIWVINEDDIDEIVLTKRKGDIINLGDYKPRKTGYTFIAWSDMGAEKTYSPNDKYIVTDDAFIVSGMQPNTYIVYFDALGGIVMQDFKSVKFDSAYGELPIPTRNGYDFDGWYTESNGGKNVTEETIVATPDKHTLYARWIEKNISPVAITLNKASATLEIGDTTALTATVAPSNATNKNVTWKSSDKNVATVANGVVTAVGKGTATITVTTVDGNKTATCTVTVTKPEEPNPEAKATVTLSNETGRAGDKVSVIVSLNTDEIINTIGVSGIAYDKSILTFDSFTQYDEVKDISILSSFDEKMMTVTIALEEPQSFNGKLFEINFIINENAEDGKSDIDLSSMIKLNSTEIVVNDIAGSVTVISELLGDINHDDCVDMNDAVLLLQHSMFPHLYPIEYKGNADFTEDGNIDMNDAVRLLQYSMFPNLYPIE